MKREHPVTTPPSKQPTSPGHIGRVQAKPFSLDFDEQVESANVLYGSHLQCSFTRSDVTSILESFSDFYPQEILSRVERVLFEQIRRYSIYF